ncbi:MAG: DUF2829 domain-containing protein, partial [Thaumarchaeota archaeon]|nr:DUF2829 domain-containing protein [Nitrososphaerota archaeon]
DMNFSKALHLIREKQKLTRTGWNGKGQYIFFLDPFELTYESLQLPNNKIYFQPFLAIKTAQNTYVPWIVSQTDLLADDWEVFKNE